MEPDKTLHGLELKKAWSDLILSGEKTIETRLYPLPEHLLKRPIAMLVVPKHVSVFKSGLSDAPSPGDAKISGFVLFHACRAYESRAAWEADFQHHRVPNDSVFAWQDGGPTMYAWEILTAEVIRPHPPSPAMKRVMRSLFVLEARIDEIILQTIELAEDMDTKHERCDDDEFGNDDDEFGGRDSEVKAGLDKEAEEVVVEEEEESHGDMWADEGAGDRPWH